MIGSDDQVVMVNCDDIGNSSRPEDEKPKLVYTLAERTSLQVILFSKFQHADFKIMLQYL